METLTKEQKRSALDLYGGRGKVLERLDRLIRLKLEEKQSNFKKMILESFMKEDYYDKVKSWIDGKTKVDRDVFLIFKPCLRLRLGDALGKPYFANEEIRNYWMAQKKNNPIRIVSPERLPVDPFEGEKGLEDYVALKAIGEFYKAA